MNGADRILVLLAATLCAVLLAGCTAFAVDRPKETTAVSLPERARLVLLTIAQLEDGHGVSFRVCVGDACPKPTRKTLAGVAEGLTRDAIGVGHDVTTVAARSREPSTTSMRSELSSQPRTGTLVIPFTSGATTLSPSARSALDAVTSEARTAALIEIRGRTDELGSMHRNDVLARNRALAVRDYLRQKELPKQTQIRVSFKGACCYLAANDTAEGRAANRRVEIEFKKAPAIALGSNRNAP